ncbi:hypothetical protein E2C01_065426 [Portunus trituberculatus]|uniref:Uncharacterized protein n=1 Tax=Portunus trituberculatus TaxID=210409 RepID=A0A5B7HMJ3_PORTR|nr:hypothetical protein [Portunus trituberculatus]
MMKPLDVLACQGSAVERCVPGLKYCVLHERWRSEIIVHKFYVTLRPARLPMSIGTQEKIPVAVQVLGIEREKEAVAAAQSEEQ